MKNEQTELIEALRREYPEYAAMQYPQPIEASGLLLHADETLVAYEITEPETFIFIIRGGKTVKVLEAGLTRNELEKKIKAYRQGFAIESLEDLRKLDTGLGYELYDRLLAGALKEAGDNKVLIVPDEVLGLLPFESLVKNRQETVSWETKEGRPYPAGVTFMGEERVFGYWQSASSMTAIRQLPKREGGGESLLVVVNPVFGNSDTRVQKGEIKLRREIKEKAAVQLDFNAFIPLPSTEDFASVLRNLWGKALILTGADASENRVKGENLEVYGEVVFATHGITDESIPYLKQPAIVLSNPDYTGEEGEDGYLTASEIMGLKMRAENVAVLACSTGIGKLMAGEGVMHLGRSFQYAGAGSVLVSLWNVEDNSTNILGGKYFEGIKRGTDKGMSLYQARCELWKEGYLHPFFWSSFILYGEGGGTFAADNIIDNRNASSGMNSYILYAAVTASAILIAAAAVLILRKKGNPSKSSDRR